MLGGDKSVLSFKEFDRIINSVKKKDLELGVIWDALGGCDKLYQTALFDEVVELLEHIFQDENEWISYWIWELNFGEEWHDGCVTEADGTDIKLQTHEDLYRLLINNMRREDKE